MNGSGKKLFIAYISKGPSEIVRVMKVEKVNRNSRIS